MKLRRAGWSIRFAPDAHALTDVPESLSALTVQRLRWDRGIVTIWLRKYRGILDPRQSAFRLIDVVAFLDILFFQVLLAFAFPVYLVWLSYRLGELGGVVLLATLTGYAAGNLLSFMAARAIGAKVPFGLIFYLPVYVVLQVSLMRVIRIIALVQELIFRSSYRDPYVPARVMSQVDVI